MKKKRIKILSSYVDPYTMRETVDEVEKYIITREPLHLMGINADKINQLSNNPRLKKIVNESKIINADGASVVLASAFLGNPIPERVAGIDLMLSLIELANTRGYSIYLIGAKDFIIKKTVRILKEKYPMLNIAGYRDGYFQEDEWDIIGNEIKNTGAQIVFVGITSPLKEYIIDRWIKNNLDSVFMGVGGSFDVISGNIPRAPKWVQSINMEWFFRMMNEPTRLFKRYLVGNYIFIEKVIKEKIKNR